MRLLVIEDDARVAYALAKELRPFGETIVAASASEAERLLALPRKWRAWFVDQGLPDGRGHEVISGARATHPFTRALLMTGALDGDIAGAAFGVGASCLQKPLTRLQLVTFLAGEADFARRLEQELERWRILDGLTTTEVDLLRRLALGEKPEGIAAARGCSEYTIKAHIRNLLDKTKDDTRFEAVIRLLRAVAGCET